MSRPRSALYKRYDLAVSIIYSMTTLAGPNSKSKCATTDALVALSEIFHISTKLSVLSGMVKYSSLKVVGPTEFAEPPLPVVGSRNSCSVIAPVSASREKAETYPGRVEVFERVAEKRYLGESLVRLLKITSSAQ